MARQSAIRKDGYTEEDAELYAEYMRAQARNNFWAYRQYIRPNLIKGWFPKDLAFKLQYFWDEYIKGNRPIILITAPPQHGKTEAVVDFITWVAGKRPDLHSIYASYSNSLSSRANRQVQRVMLGPRFCEVFPNTKLSANAGSSDGLIAARNTTLLEYVGHRGTFRNTTVRGAVTGFGLDLGAMDDLIKGREQANSPKARDNAWEWFTDDVYSRFSEYAGLIMLMTRWNVDDPAGRLLEQYPNVILAEYKAIALEDEEHRKAGEALFPEHKSLEFLLKRKALETQASWEALYQQSPSIRGGGLFPIDKFVIEDRPINYKDIVRSVRYWDKAGTTGGGAYTAGVLMHEMKDGSFLVEDVVRGQWGARDREKIIREVAEVDGDLLANLGTPMVIWVEQEPGSGGKESAESSIASLKGFTVKADRVTGSKEVRAEPYAAQVQGGNVVLAKGPWNKAFIDEHEVFPNGNYKDQVDSAAAAFIKLTQRERKYDTSLRWVRG